MVLDLIDVEQLVQWNLLDLLRNHVVLDEESLGSLVEDEVALEVEPDREELDLLCHLVQVTTDLLFLVLKQTFDWTQDYLHGGFQSDR